MSSNSKERACAMLAAFAAAMTMSLVAAPGDVMRFALPGWAELELVEVSGKSRIPLQHLYMGNSKDILSDVASPTYWIGRFEVTEKQFAAVMGSPSSTNANDRMPVANVRWIDAVTFCDALNHVCRGEIPQGYRFDLPTVIEWAHAYACGATNVCRYAGGDDLDALAWHGMAKTGGGIEPSALHLPGLKSPNAIGAYDMSGNVGEFVFLADSRGGNVRMGGSFALPEQFCEVNATVHVDGNAVADDLGFRVALVPSDARDPDGKTLALETKARILLACGKSALAKRFAAMSLGLVGHSDSEAYARLRELWLTADRAVGRDSGSWRDLMKSLSAPLGEVGCHAAAPLAFWGTIATDECWTELRDAARACYRESRIVGGSLGVNDLPTEVATNGTWAAGSRVPAISCDFSGDGLKDLIVELDDCANGSGERRYGFFIRNADGSYHCAGEPVKALGICLLPRDKKSGGVAALVLFRVDDGVLAPGVMECSHEGGKTGLRVAWPFERSFHLTEPLVVRPVCWPWR